MAMQDLGSASGKVRIVYSSTGADKVAKEFDQIKTKLSETVSPMATFASKLGINSTELQRFTQIQKEVANATKVVSLMEANLQNTRSNTLSKTKDIARAETLLVKSRESLAAINKVAAISASRIPDSFASAGRAAADVFSSELTKGQSKIRAAMQTLGHGAATALSIGLKIGLAGVAAGVLTVFAGAAAILKGGFTRLEALDQAAFKMKALGASTDQVKVMMDEVNQSVTDTAFSLDQMATVAANAFTAGVKPGQKMLDFLNAVANASAAGGVDLQTISNYLTNVVTQGHLLGGDLTYLRQYIPIVQWLSKSMNKSEQDILAMVSAGKIGIGDLTKAINDNAGAAAKGMQLSIKTVIENTLTSLKRLGAAFLAPLFGDATGEASNVAKAIQAIKQKFDELTKYLKAHQAGLISFWAGLGKFAIIAGRIITDVVGGILVVFGWLWKGVANLQQQIAKAVSTTLRIAAKTAGIFGRKEDEKRLNSWADTVDQAAQNSYDLGDTLSKAGSKVLSFNKTLDKGWDIIEKWEKEAQAAAKAAKDLAVEEDKTVIPTISVAQALKKLEISSNSAAEGITGSKKQFKEFLDVLREKGASQQLIDTIKRLRYEFENGGRQAANLADAIGSLDDATQSASDKAEKLISALQDLGKLPGKAEDSLDSYNETLRKTLDYNSDFVDRIDVLGPALIKQGNLVDTLTKNGHSLNQVLKENRKAMYEAAIAGADPMSVWNTTSAALKNVLAQFGIFGDLADNVIKTYLGDPHEFQIIMETRGKADVQKDLASVELQINDAKKKGKNEFQVKITSNPNDLKAVTDELGIEWKQFDELTQTVTLGIPDNANIEDVKKKLEKYIADDPAKIPSELDILKKTQQEIIKEATGADASNPLKIPAVLDFPTNPDIPGGSPNAPATPGVNPPATGGSAGSATPPPTDNTTSTAKLHSNGWMELNRSGKTYWIPPLYMDSVDPQTLTPKDGFTWYETPQGIVLGKTNEFPTLPPGLGVGTGAAGTGLPMPGQNPMAPSAPIAPTDTGGIPMPAGGGGQGYSNWSQASDYLDSVLQQQDSPLMAQGHDQGQNFAEAFAQGILDAIETVKQAALELAKVAGEPLGQSPAPYGPLSGSGWTYNRGRNFSNAFAAGIISGSGTINRASLKIADSSTGTLQEQIGIFLKDYGQFGDFMKHAFDLVSSLGDITFNILAFAQNVSGGRAFGKTYVKNPQAALDLSRRLQLNNTLNNLVQPGANATTSANVRPNSQLPTSGLGGFLVNSLRNAGLSEDVIRGIVAMNQVESGGKAEGFLGFTQSQAATPEAAVNKFLNEQWIPRTKNGIPGVSGTGQVTDWNQFMTFIRERIVGQNGVVDWQGNQQPPAAEYQRRLMEALGITAPSATLSSNRPSTNLAQLTGGGTQTMTPALLQRLGLTPLYQPGTSSVPSQMVQFARQFGLAPSTYPGGGTLHQAGFAFDFSGTQQDMEKFAQWVINNAVGQTLQLIYQNPTTGKTYGVAGGQVVGPGTAFPNYYAADWAQHQTHVHGAFTSLTPGGNAPVPVALTGDTNQILSNIDVNQIGLPQAIQDMANSDDLLRQGIIGSKFGGLQDDQAVTILQHIDGLISDQNAMNTPESKATANYLGGIRDNIMNVNALQEGPSQLDQAQNIAQGVVGIAQDVFGIIDSVMKSVASANDIGNQLARGIGSTEDIYKMVDSVQSFIELAQRIASTAGDAIGFAASIVGAAGAGSAGGDMGSTEAVGMALSAVSSATQIVSSIISAVNASIDLAQEAYRIGTKYIGRTMEKWFGLPGATDVQYLLDTMSGQLQVYSQENPLNKTTFDTWGKRTFGDINYQRQPPANTFYIYQGPGQDPRDTMNNAMFAIKSSGVGAFGYEG